MRTFKLICDLFPGPRERVRVYPGDSVLFINPPSLSLSPTTSPSCSPSFLYLLSTPQHDAAPEIELHPLQFCCCCFFFYTKPLTLLSQGSLPPYGARSRSSELVFNTFSKNHYFRRISN